MNLWTFKVQGDSHRNKSKYVARYHNTLRPTDLFLCSVSVTNCKLATHVSCSAGDMIQLCMTVTKWRKILVGATCHLA